MSLRTRAVGVLCVVVTAAAVRGPPHSPRPSLHVPAAVRCPAARAVPCSVVSASRVGVRACLAGVLASGWCAHVSRRPRHRGAPASQRPSSPLRHTRRRAPQGREWCRVPRACRGSRVSFRTEHACGASPWTRRVSGGIGEQGVAGLALTCCRRWPHALADATATDAARLDASSLSCYAGVVCSVQLVASGMPSPRGTRTIKQLSRKIATPSRLDAVARSLDAQYSDRDGVLRARRCTVLSRRRALSRPAVAPPLAPPLTYSMHARLLQAT